MALFITHKETKFQVGDVVRIHLQAHEGTRHGFIIEGQVLGVRGEGENKSFLMRRIATGGIGVEYIFPLTSPTLAKIEVKQRLGEGVRRAKLYFLRGRAKVAFEKIGRRAVRKGKVEKVTRARKRRKSRKGKK